MLRQHLLRLFADVRVPVVRDLAGEEHETRRAMDHHFRKALADVAAFDGHDGIVVAMVSKAASPCDLRF